MVYRVARSAESLSGRSQTPPRAGREALRLRGAEREARILADIGVPVDLVARAATEALRLRVPVDVSLLASRAVDETGLYRALARRLGIPFLVDAALRSDMDYAAAAAAGVAPLAPGASGGARWLAAPRGRALAALASLPDPSGFAMTTPRRFGALLRAAAAERIAADAALSLHRLEPRLSALSRPEAAVRRAAWAVAAALAACALLWPWPTAACLWTLLVMAFSAATVSRLFQVAASFEPEPDDPALEDRDLPDYTVVVALYREAPVARALVRALERLDYPRARLDVKFVVEADDVETFAALAAAIPGAEYEVIVAPPGEPRTKPRALDIALPFARGELLTVFDAEDEPEPDQLRKAAARFARAGPDLGCLQARLAIDNFDDNWLAGLYAIDYAALFEAGNPGVAALDLPMLLGGTSNHFRVETLRAIGGWDAWNVTEDADLGLRLARCGLRVETLRSHTFEEAPNAVRPFLNQRVRWMKGWMQTAFVHMRDPLALWWNLRPLAFVSVLTTFVSGVLSPLLWPYFFVGLALDAFDGALFSPANAFEFVVDFSACSLAAAGFGAMIWPALVGMRRQGLMRLWPLLFLLPIWHVLLSVAAWRAVIDLWRDPHRWAKTTHGLARSRKRAHRQATSRASSAPITRATPSPISDRTTTPARS